MGQYQSIPQDEIMIEHELPQHMQDILEVKYAIRKFKNWNISFNEPILTMVASRLLRENNNDASKTKYNLDLIEIQNLYLQCEKEFNEKRNNNMITNVTKIKDQEINEVKQKVYELETSLEIKHNLFYFNE